MTFITLWKDLLHLFYPHCCPSCTAPLHSSAQIICPACVDNMPRTFDETAINNATEKMFAGRIMIHHAWSTYYFHKGGMMQTLIHDVKYKKEKALGFFLGTMMGTHLQESNLHGSYDIIIPLPMHKRKELQRGYNQATVIAEGLSAVTKIPILHDAIRKTKSTTSQTSKHRMARWKNASGNFDIVKPKLLEGKHILLVDDVITTGATLEACGRELLKLPGIQLSIATLARAA